MKPVRYLLIVVALSYSLGCLIAGCLKPTTFNGENPSGHGELDRLQEIINSRFDLEVVKDQLEVLDVKIRNAIAQHAPQTVLSPAAPQPGHGCNDPFGHNIGDSYSVNESYGRPAPTPDQWHDITTTLNPTFGVAGFRFNGPPNQSPASGNDSQIRDDGALIFLTNLSQFGVLTYGYTTGCHLPAAWRTEQPPRNDRPANDPHVHYPYLYMPPGGRTAPP